MEKIKIKKTGKSKFGYYLLLEDKSFRTTTEAVSKFLSDKTPCEVEITGEETGEKGSVITKVKPLNTTPIQSQNYGKQYAFQKARDTKHIEMVLSYAKDLVVADKADNLDSAVEALMFARDKILEWEKNKNNKELEVKEEKVN